MFSVDLFCSSCLPAGKIQTQLQQCIPVDTCRSISIETRKFAEILTVWSSTRFGCVLKDSFRRWPFFILPSDCNPSHEPLEEGEIRFSYGMLTNIT